MKTHSDELTLFVAVVEAGSFRQAAENLGMDNSVVSRGIKRLEEKLSTVLLNRTTRRVSLTEEGSWFYQRAVKILTEMSEAEGHLLMRREQPEGVLRVDAATPFILHRLVPLIGEFRRRYPAIELQLHSSEGFINLMERRVDMAIRIGELTDSSLRALPLGRSRLRLLASPHLFERARHPAPTGGSAERSRAARLFASRSPQPLAAAQCRAGGSLCHYPQPASQQRRNLASAGVGGAGDRLSVGFHDRAGSGERRAGGGAGPQ